MNDCEYCMDGRKIHGVEDGSAKIVKLPYSLGYVIEFDNSGGEYPKGNIEINFCPYVRQETELKLYCTKIERKTVCHTMQLKEK